MIPEIKKILYATDLSKNARYAFNYAASLADQYGALITILHVMEKLPAGSTNLVAFIVGEDRLEDLEKKHTQEAFDMIHSRLEQFCSDMSAELDDCPFMVEEIIVKQGDPARVILDLVVTKDFDIIVMGSHGLGVLADALMGGKAHRVVRRCKKPILIVRLPED